MAIGILAFGSLLDHPGSELEARVVRRIDGLTTPFSVEFSRSSRSRDGAPTLVPVSRGGVPLAASVLELDPALDERAARDLLYRRETSRPDVRATTRRPTWIQAVRDFAGLDLCVYTALPPNLVDPTPERLAELAVQSAAFPSGAARRDGISYLEAHLRRGATTPLTQPYVEAVLALTGAGDLDEAWRRAREGAC